MPRPQSTTRRPNLYKFSKQEKQDVMNKIKFINSLKKNENLEQEKQSFDELHEELEELKNKNHKLLTNIKKLFKKEKSLKNKIYGKDEIMEQKAEEKLRKMLDNEEKRKRKLSIEKEEEDKRINHVKLKNLYKAVKNAPKDKWVCILDNTLDVRTNNKQLSDLIKNYYTQAQQFYLVSVWKKLAKYQKPEAKNMIHRLTTALKYGTHLIMNIESQSHLFKIDRWLEETWFGEKILQPKKFLSKENLKMLAQKYPSLQDKLSGMENNGFKIVFLVKDQKIPQWAQHMHVIKVKD